MSTMYVISNETNEIVATITGPATAGRNQNRFHEEIFETKFGSNDYSNSFTDFGIDYATSVEEIEFNEDGVVTE